MADAQPRGVAWQDTAVGLAVVALSAIVVWQTLIIPENAIYARVGPKVFPWLSALLLAVMGVLLTFAGLRGGWEHDSGADTDWRSLGWLGLGLALNAALIAHAGFIIASSLMFIAVARAFGSVQPVRDALIAFALCLGAYVGFDRVLGYKIGQGLIEGLL